MSDNAENLNVTVGSVETTDNAGKSAASTSGVFAAADRHLKDLGLPEGVAYGILPDPEASGEDALKPDYDDYENEFKSPTQQALREGFAPGVSPDELAVRSEKANADGVVDPEEVKETVKEEKDESPVVIDGKPASKEDQEALRDHTDEAPEIAPDPEGPEGQVEEGQDPVGDHSNDEDEKFDPRGKTVPEINAYLSTADEAEKDRVLKLELEQETPRTSINGMP